MSVFKLSEALFLNWASVFVANILVNKYFLTNRIGLFKAQEIYERSLIYVGSTVVVTVQVGPFQHDKPNIYGLLVPRRCWELKIKKRENLIPCFNWNITLFCLIICSITKVIWRSKVLRHPFYLPRVIILIKTFLLSAPSPFWTCIISLGKQCCR